VVVQVLPPPLEVQALVREVTVVIVAIDEDVAVAVDVAVVPRMRRSGNLSLSSADS